MACTLDIYIFYIELTCSKATLYELRYANAIDRKRELLVEVAKWSGDGLKTSCLKLPTN